MSREELRSVFLALFHEHRLDTKVLQRNKVLIAKTVQMVCSCGWKSEAVHADDYEKELHFSLAEDHLLEFYVERFCPIVEAVCASPSHSRKRADRETIDDEQKRLFRFAATNVLVDLYEQDPNAMITREELLIRARKLVAEWNSNPDLKAKILAIEADAS